MAQQHLVNTKRARFLPMQTNRANRQTPFRWTAAGLSIVALVACVRASSPSRVQTSHTRSTMFSSSQTAAFLHRFQHCGGGPLHAVSETWTPTSSQLAEADRQTRTALASALSDGPTLSTDDYYVQYFGVVIRGRQMMFANGIHEVAARGSPSDQWRAEPLVICDIGRAGFQTEYDVVAKRVGAIRFAEAYLPTP